MPLSTDIVILCMGLPWLAFGSLKNEQTNQHLPESTPPPTPISFPQKQQREEGLIQLSKN